MPLFSSTKTYLPSFNSTVLRPHLIKQLQQIIAHKVILVVAPPGYGKTTAIGQFAHQTTQPALWQTIEEHNRDLPELFRDVIDTFSVLFPNMRDMSFNPHLPPTELAYRITAYLRENATEDFIYILDDVHHLIAAPAAERWLHSFVTQLPKQCHMIIGSRLLPNLPIQEMAARREIDVLRIDQLQFNAEDLVTLAQIYNVPISLSDALEMVERLDGWAAGLALALQTSSPHQIKQAFTDYLEPETLFAELAEAMFNTQSPSLQDFMLKTSVLETITPELSSTVLQIPNSLSYLNQLFQQGLFLTKADGKLRYHTLFREFLQKEFQRRNATQFLQLHKQVGQWAEEYEQDAIAFEHFVEADCIDKARSIADRMAHPYLGQGKVETLLHWLTKLQNLTCSPRLWHTCSIIYTERYLYDKAERLLDEAEQTLLETEDTEGLSVIRLQRATILLQRGDYQAAIHLIEDLVKTDNFKAAHHIRALHVMSIAYLHLGDVQKAGTLLERALEEGRKWKDPYIISRLLQDLDVIYMRLGQIDAASACLQEAVSLKREIGDSGSLAMALNNLGFHYHQRGEYKRAAETFDEGFKIGTKLGDNRVESYLLWSLGDLQRDRGNYGEAHRLYTKALQLSKRYEPSLRCSILLSISTLHRWQGVFYDARIVAEEAVALARQHHLQVELLKAEVLSHIARFLSGEKTDGLGWLEEKIQRLQTLQSEGDLSVLYALSCLIAIHTADRSSALNYLRLIEKLQYSTLQPAIAEIYHTSKSREFFILHKARFERLNREFDLLAQAQLIRSLNAPSLIDEAQTFFLEINTLGREEIKRDGRIISIQSWRATRAKELFFYLLAAGPMPREHLYLTLWSDSSRDQARNNFHSTLHRIRQVLGENVIQHEGDIYQINPHIELRWDVQTLLRLQKTIKNLSPYDARTTEGLRKALSLYKGDFLPSLSTDWVLNQRETLRQVYIELLVINGDTATARYEYEEALKAYRQALTINPYEESIYRSIMRCQSMMGERGQIALEYKKLKRLLKTDLDVEPSEETQRLVLTLLG